MEFILFFSQPLKEKANPQKAHLQITQAKPTSKISKRAFLMPFQF
jgi:hypothetical protein